MERIMAEEEAAKVLTAMPAITRCKPVIAAAVFAGLIILAGSLYLYVLRSAAKVDSDGKTTAKHRSWLTLPGDIKILLDTMKLGSTMIFDGWTLDKVNTDSFICRDLNVGAVSRAKYEFSVDTGLPVHIRLPDDSWISLANGSTIAYHITDVSGFRQYHLSGKAGFKVASNAGSPCIVDAGNVLVKVLGTTFDISAYSDDPVTEITISSGSIRVIKGKDSATLDGVCHHQARIVEDSLQLMQLSDSAVKTIMAWQEEEPKLVFNNTRLEDALRIIARRYGVTLQGAENIHSAHVKGTYYLRDSLSANIIKLKEVLTGISLENKDSLIIVR